MKGRLFVRAVTLAQLLQVTLMKWLVRVDGRTSEMALVGSVKSAAYTRCTASVLHLHFIVIKD